MLHPSSEPYIGQHGTYWLFFKLEEVDHEIHDSLAVVAHRFSKKTA
jgi:hypothetical protein